MLIVLQAVTLAFLLCHFLDECLAEPTREAHTTQAPPRSFGRLAGRLACLDVSHPELQPLLMPGLELPRTVLESDLGLPLADCNYFAELTRRKPAERLFVCVPGMD